MSKKSKAMPPKEFRFKPGTSGNPKGRPKGSRNKKPKMRTPALDETVLFPINGVRRRMTRREAIMEIAQSRALSLRDDDLTILLLNLEFQLSQAEIEVDYRPVRGGIVAGRSLAIKNVEAIVQALGLGRLIYKEHAAQRVALKPDLVSLALSRFEDRRLTREEQKLVVAFTLTPWKVDWPNWWEEDLRNGKCRLPKRFLADDQADWKRALSPPPPVETHLALQPAKKIELPDMRQPWWEDDL